MMVPVTVRLSGRIVRFMRVLVMFVMYMQVLVVQRLVPMFVLVALRQKQPNSRTHKRCGND